MQHVISIGDRLRQLRSERGLTQETLAEQAGVSVDIIKKLEQGRRDSARLTTLARLANTLDVGLADLTDKRPRLDRSGDRLVLGLRDALLSPDLLPGIDPDDGGDATPLPDLAGSVQRAWKDYWAGGFVDLARTMPHLLAEVRLSERSLGSTAAGVLAQVYQLVACLLVHLGRDDLAAVGAERAITAARAGDDELQWATLYGTYAWVLLNQARHDEAEQLAALTAERIEPKLSTASSEHLTVWGGMVLWALAAAAAADKLDHAGEYLSLATAGSARLPRDRHDYHVNFGPTQVAMQATHAYAVLHQPDRALAAATDVRRDDLFTISHGCHLLDLAQAHVDLGAADAAEGVLREAKNVAPVWFRHQALARALVAELRQRRVRPSSALRDLVQALNPR
jgi:transcriptional regulator with XRE-family HTH domain